MQQRGYWQRLRPRIAIERRNIVDSYFQTEEDPVECWAKVKELLPTDSTSDKDLVELEDLLQECSAPGRWRA